MSAASAPARPAPRPLPVARLRTVALTVATGAALLAIAYFANRPADASGLTPVELAGVPNGPAPIVGQPAPDIAGVTIEGTAFRLSDLSGSPVWLTFGATWCQPCRAENQDIEDAFEAYKERGLLVVQVYMGEDAATVADYTERVGLTYLRVADPSKQLTTEYRILGIPTHFFIDRAGVLQQLKVGTLDRDSMTGILDQLIR